MHRPALSSVKTDCVDPLTPTSGGDVLGNFLVNTYFTSGTDFWSLTGQLASQVTNETLEFHRMPGAPAPKIEQVTVQAAGEDQRVAATFEMGNTSSTRQRVSVQLQDSSIGAYLTLCTFWLAPSTPKALYAMTAYASRPWANATVAVLPVTAGGASTHAWLQIDTVTLAKITGAILGTECFEPGSFTLGGGGDLQPSPAPAASALLAAEPSTTSAADAVVGSEAEARPTPGPSLAVAVTLHLPGTGSGLVTSSPAGLSCGGTGISCTGWFAEHATVTLTPAADAGSTFVGWTGACSGTGICVVSAVGTPDVTATFIGPLTITYYHLDVIGSVRAITDAVGSVVTRHDYFAFGEGTPLTGDPHRFTGKQRDPETVFDYFEARYYRNVWGRFTTVDPVMDKDQNRTDPQQWNRYAYSRNNPLRFVDPNGLEIYYATPELERLFSYLAARSAAVRATLALYAGPNSPNLTISQAVLGADADGPTNGSFKASLDYTTDSPPGSGDFSRLPKDEALVNAGLANGSLLTSARLRDGTLQLDASFNLKAFGGRSKQDREAIETALHEIGHADHAARNTLEYYRQGLEVNQRVNGIRLPHDRRPVERYANQYRDKALPNFPR